jgi:hypothetical protein
VSRARAAIAAAVVVVGAAIAVLLATGALSSQHRAAKRRQPVADSPACLPKAVDASAKLARLNVDVSPAPGTGTANPATQISFLGVPASQIHVSSVTGSATGSHPGRLDAYSQGDGASFVPATPFASGERVTVTATIGAGTAGRHVSFAFGIDHPYPTAAVPPFPNPQAPTSDYQTFATLPGAQPPTLTVTTPDSDPGAGDILTTNGPSPGQYGPLIYTPQGRLVWFDHLPDSNTAEDLNVQSYEGHRDLTFWQGKVLDLGFGQGEDVVLNDRYQAVAHIHGANGLHADLHEFQLAGNGVAYITAYNPILCNLTSAGGRADGAIVDPAIQEIDTRTGLVRWEWHSLDHVAVSESETAPPESRNPWEWFHLNSIDPQTDGDLFISARSTWAGYQIRSGSGTIAWRLGGTNSSFKLGKGTETAWQHDGRILANGEVSFFDDGSNPPVHSQSRGLHIALDFATHEAHLTASYTHPGPLLSVSQGNMQTLPSGNSMIDYGSIPDVAEYSPSGALLFDAHLPFEFSSYRGFRYPWSARPATPPVALAGLNNTGEETIVHASWNGATEVASWRILAGAKPSALEAVSKMQASGFESSTSVPQKYAYVAVQALDGAGRVIGASKPAPVRSYASSL